MFVNIIIIKLIIYLIIILLFLIFVTLLFLFNQFVSKSKICSARSLVNLKMYIKSHKKYIGTKI